MFGTKRGPDSATTALKLLKSHFEKEKDKFRFDTVSALKALESVLPFIANEYWSDCDYDNRMTYANMKEEIVVLTPLLANLLNTMRNIHPQSRMYLNDKAAIRKNGDLFSFEDCCGQLIGIASVLFDASQKVSRERHAKRKGHSHAVPNACRRLIANWESVAGRPFKFGTGTHPSAAGGDGRNEEFTHPDAQLVNVALRGIDPNVTLGQVRTGIRSVKADLKRHIRRSSTQ